MLAMSEEEVEEFLAGARGDERRSVAARGRMARRCRAREPDDDRVTLPGEGLEFPEQLYEFFADEVYRSLEPDNQVGLGLLATAPSLDRELAAELLGAGSRGTSVYRGARPRCPRGA